MQQIIVLRIIHKLNEYCRCIASKADVDKDLEKWRYAEYTFTVN